MTAVNAPQVKGWCPGAYRPMMSGDGLVVRVRPVLGRLTRAQAEQLAVLAQHYGSGVIDVTSRANLQIRGVSDEAHDKLLVGLLKADLLDATPEEEARRNILTTPFWSEGDGTAELYKAVVASLGDLPKLPAKVGIAFDTGAHPVLARNSADFRFEQGRGGALILRADGAQSGMEISLDRVKDALCELVNWFLESGGAEAGRMARHLDKTALPEKFQGIPPADQAAQPDAGAHAAGYLVGAGFGAVEARTLLDLLAETEAPAIRTTPWRLLLLEGVSVPPQSDVITTPGHPLLNVHACPGAPFCTQAESATRPLARTLASRVPFGRKVHVSGCSKGCAHPGPADVTLVGSSGNFDLVRDGVAWDEPETRGISVEEITRDLTF